MQMRRMIYEETTQLKEGREKIVKMLVLPRKARRVLKLVMMELLRRSVNSRLSRSRG
jgi:hypothetical protein